MRRDVLADLELDFVMTHLACADEPEHPLNAEQLARFEQLRGRLPPAPTSIGNSAGTLLDAAHRGDLARPGIALYGGNPFSDRPNPMEPVVTLTAPILQLRDLGEPATVGYGATYVAHPPARVAVVGIGYADGYPRSLSNCGTAAVNGRRVPVVGRVSMDLISIDVGGIGARLRSRRRYRRAHRPHGRRRRGRGGGRHDQLRDPDRHGPPARRATTSRTPRSLKRGRPLRVEWRPRSATIDDYSSAIRQSSRARSSAG